MSEITLQQRQVKAFRTSHPCEWCKGVIEKGAPGLSLTMVMEGDLCHFYAHDDCAEAWVRDGHSQDGEGCNLPHDRGKTCYETEGARQCSQV